MKNFNKTIAFSSILIGSSSCLMADNKPAIEKPNLIVIMADDLGYADVGFNGCKDIPTPNIDSIAKNGIRFTNGYVSYAVCGPSRAGFMTGRYQQRFGFERNPQYRPDDPNMGLPKTEMTLADSLGKVGYNSGIIGKWHLGAHPSNHPLKRGFNHFFGHLGGGHQYFPELLTIKDSYNVRKDREESDSYRTWILNDHQPEKTTKYLTDEFSDAAIRFVEKNKDKPFFLYLAYNAPHGPLQATEKYLKRFPDIKDKKRRTYAAMVSAVDDGVGLLLNKLKELKLEDNTIIFFLSDNGGPEKKNASDNGPLRDGKGSIYEGGWRVPFAMQWTKKIKPGVYDYPVNSLDIFGTISALSGSPTKNPLDGVNLIPYITGEIKKAPHKTVNLRKFDAKQHAIRLGNYKLVTRENGEEKELYDLKDDIGEKNNIAEKYPEKVKEIDAIRVQWDSELIEPTFLGLTHTKRWMKKKKKKPKK